MKIGTSVFEMVTNDQDAELGAVRAYNDAIALAHEVSDQASVDLLIRILKMAEGHVDWAEIQRAQIEQMGLENYLKIRRRALQVRVHKNITSLSYVIASRSLATQSPVP